MKRLKLRSTSIVVALAFLISCIGIGLASGQTGSPIPGNKLQSQVVSNPSATTKPTPARAASLLPLTISKAEPRTSNSIANSDQWENQICRRIWPLRWSTFFPPVWSNWALVVAAIIAAWVANNTLVEIRKSNRTALRVALATKNAAIATQQYVALTKTMAEAAEQSAKAAQASVHISRPFIVVDKIVMDVSYVSHRPTQRIPRAVCVTLRNAGNGPAVLIADEVIGSSDFFEWSPTNVVLGEVEYSAKDARPIIEQTPVVAVAGTATFWVRSGPANQQQHDDMISGRKRIAVFGKIKYRGPTRELYTTWFFWWYRPLDPDPYGGNGEFFVGPDYLNETE